MDQSGVARVTLVQMKHRLVTVPPDWTAPKMQRLRSSELAKLTTREILTATAAEQALHKQMVRQEGTR